MAVRSSIKNPQWDPWILFDEPGIPPVCKDDERDLYLWPNEPTGPPPALRCEEEYSLWPLGFKPICDHEWFDLHLIDGFPPFIYPDRDSLSLDPMTLTWDHEWFDLHLKRRPDINEWRCDPYWLASTFPALYCDDKSGPWALHLYPNGM